MWVFIKANAGSKKFDFESKKNTIWFSIEKTERERLVAKKTGYLVKALTDFIVDTQRATAKEAAKFIDGDYVRGYVMYLVPAHETKCATTNVVIEHNKPSCESSTAGQGSHIGPPNLARDIIALREFKWDDHLVFVNDIGADPV